MADSTDRDWVLAALAREIDWRLPTAEDLIAAAGEPVDRAALYRALDALVGYVAYTDDEPPRPENALAVLRAALEREGVSTDSATTAAAVAAAERSLG